MSQFPPPPPQGQYPPPPPGQYPPAGQTPSGGYSMAPAKAGNGMALASLICGILGCLAVPSVFAVILGFVGFSRGKDPRRGGRGMAMTGIILGLIGMIVWSGIIYGGFWLGGELKAGLAPVTGVVENLAKNDVPGARQYVTASVSNVDLETVRVTVSNLGKFTGQVDNPKFATSTTNGVTTYTLTGKAIFEKGSCNLAVSLDRVAPKQFKVSQLKVQ